ncbi:ribosomal protein S19 family protein [Candidatus Micrarchaeota archaeon]|nr:ribosomal protein S19 family protein [Candidatus Micrarchaeota archaeon]
MRKEVYKGLDENAFKGMPMEKFMELIGSRERRSLKRLSTNLAFKKLIDKVKKVLATNPKKVIKTHSREAVILPEWLGLTFGVHNGKQFKTVVITIDKLGRRLGDYSHSTGRVLHAGPGIGATRGSKFVAVK